MPDTVNAAKNPDLASYARSVETEFEKMRVAGLGKVPVVTIDQLPTDGSRNLEIVSGTTKGTALCYFNGSDWLFSDDYTVVS